MIATGTTMRVAWLSGWIVLLAHIGGRHDTQASAAPQPEAANDGEALEQRGPDAILDGARVDLQHRPRTLGSASNHAGVQVGLA